MSSYYLDRYATKRPFFEQTYSGNPNLIVVIPAFNEPDLKRAIHSLQCCEPPPCEVLLMVIINQPESCDDSIHQVNQRVFDQIKQLQGHFPLLISFAKLPDKKAGVGLARKTGMDEAVRIFDSNESDGVIICFDADCQCEPNFLVEIEKQFRSGTTYTALTFYEHPLDGENQEAILNYELYLRYYVDALRWAGFPHAFQTLGSCIAVRSDAYMKQGGMNTRKAGEDFYFIHKMTAVGHIHEINSTTIFPSDRLSDRVPFGTGHAIGQYLAAGDPEYPVYSPHTFEDLRKFLNLVPGLYENKQIDQAFPVSIQSFLIENRFQEKLQELIYETRHYDAFRKRFFQWMDGLKVLQLVHHCREHYYENEPIMDAFEWLNRQYLHLESIPENKKDALLAIRAFDRKNRFYIT